MYAAMSGYEIIGEIGVENIRAKSMRQTARLIELAEEAGFRVNSPADPAERGGTVVDRCSQRLRNHPRTGRRDYLVDYRPGAGIRVAPHFYTKDEELDLVIREIAQSRAACAPLSLAAIFFKLVSKSWKILLYSSAQLEGCRNP